MAPDDETPYLRVEDLVVRFGEHTVLDHVSLSARRGEITVILGPSGCGKSTLLRHVIGLRAPAAGRVLIGGRDLYRAGEEEHEEILRNIGMSFQGGALFNSMTLLSNVALPIIEHLGADVRTAEVLARMKLALVGLERSAGLLPAEVSGGMRKRAALARALALDPALLLFDEPSAGLDPVTSRELDTLILRLKERFDMTIIVVSHELESIRTIADHAVMLDAGKIIADGPLKEVEALSHPKVRAFFDREPPDTSQRESLVDAIVAEGA